MGIAWWVQRTSTSLAAVTLGACQLVAGLGDLEPSAAGSGGATTSSGPGPGSGGQGGGGGMGGGGCADPCVQVVRTETDAELLPIRHVAVDDTHVYFAGSSIWRAPLMPDSVRQPLVPQPQPIRGMTLDSINGLVLWTRDDAGVYRIARNGSGGPDLLYPVPGEEMGPVEARGGWAYWIRGPDVGAPPSETGNGVHCTDALTGPNGTDTWLGGSPRWPVAAIAVAQVGATQVAYWHRYEGIWRREGCPMPGAEGHFAIYSMDPVTAYGLATDGQALYWTHRRGGGAVYRKALNSEEGQPGDVFEGDQSFPGHLTVAAGHVYWSTTSLGCDEPIAAIHRKPADGSGEAELLQSGLTCPSAFAVDPGGQFIYWADQNTIYRLPLGS